MATVMRRFERMSRLRDYTVEKGLLDPRGWKVVDGERRPVGEVKDLIVDTDRMTASYMDVELDAKMFDLPDGRRIQIPMLRAHRDGDQRRVVVSELTRSWVTALSAAHAAHDARFWEEWWAADASATQANRVPAHDPVLVNEAELSDRTAVDEMR